MAVCINNAVQGLCTNTLGRDEGMTIETRDFGSVELDENELIEFRVPIFGFEELKRFALLSDDEAGAGIYWLQSVEKQSTCFILLDPLEVGLEYHPQWNEETAQILQLREFPAILVIAVVPDDFKDTTVNLKSPVIINKANKWAAQVILDEDYPIRMRLFSEEVSGC